MASPGSGRYRPSRAMNGPLPLPSAGRAAGAAWAACLAAALSTALVACDALAVPSADSSAAGAGPSLVAASPSSAFPSFVRPTPTPLPPFVAHVVVRGDSLGSIARRYATTARSIAFWNRDHYPSLDPLSPGYRPNLIQPGWVLLVRPGVVFDETDLEGSPGPSSGSSPSAGPSGSPNPG